MITVPSARAGSLNVNVTWAGTTFAVEPPAGEVPTRMLCACAAVADPTSRAATASTTASARGPQRVPNMCGRWVTSHLSSGGAGAEPGALTHPSVRHAGCAVKQRLGAMAHALSLIHISEPTRQAEISYAV